MKLRIILFNALALTLFLSTSLTAQTMTGLEVVESVYNRTAPQDMQSVLTMTLINSRGNERQRTIHQYLRDFPDGERKIMFFAAPADVRNTAFMNWSYNDGNRDDDQWIYLPALKKVKRIASDSKGDNFMGSDFTYDDLGDRHPTEDIHKILRQEELDGEMVYVVESTSKDKDYMYSKTITWILPEKWYGKKREFYDEDGELLKILTVDGIQAYDKYWIITGMTMHNVQKDHRTTIRLTDIQVDQDISQDFFTERMMKRGIR